MANITGESPTDAAKSDVATPSSSTGLMWMMLREQRGLVSLSAVLAALAAMLDLAPFLIIWQVAREVFQQHPDANHKETVEL
jgi:hypothetical protein